MTFLTKGIWLFLLEDSGRFFAWEWFNNIKTYNIGRHVKFIDYIKHYQQPLSKLARSTNPTEKKRISSLFLDFLGFQHPYYSTFFLQDLSEEDRTFVLDYLCPGRGCFPYEVVTGFGSLSVKPDGDFWSIEIFYSRLSELRMRNLSDFNDIYNIQDVYILGVRVHVKDSTGFSPRCFMSASTLSGAIERAKSKVILTYPRDVEIVDLMEKFLSEG